MKNTVTLFNNNEKKYILFYKKKGKKIYFTFQINILY